MGSVVGTRNGVGYLLTPHDKTKTAESKIAKLVTAIVYYDTSPSNEYYSKVKVRVRGRRDELCTSIDYRVLLCSSCGLNCGKGLEWKSGSN